MNVTQFVAGSMLLLLVVFPICIHMYVWLGTHAYYTARHRAVTRLITKVKKNKS